MRYSHHLSDLTLSPHMSPRVTCLFWQTAFWAFRCHPCIYMTVRSRFWHMTCRYIVRCQSPPMMYLWSTQVNRPFWDSADSQCMQCTHRMRSLDCCLHNSLRCLTAHCLSRISCPHRYHLSYSWLLIRSVLPLPYPDPAHRLFRWYTVPMLPKAAGKVYRPSVDWQDHRLLSRFHPSLHIPRHPQARSAVPLNQPVQFSFVNQHRQHFWSAPLWHP